MEPPTYRVEVSPRAERDLKKLRRQNPQDYDRILAAIRQLASDPHPQGCEKLSNRDSWRVRAGDYRAIYLVDDEAPEITILGVAHRREVYRKR